MNDTLKQLKAAAERCEGYLIQYGVELEWSLSPLGLKLTGRCGADKVERYLNYMQVSTYKGDLMALTEQHVLRGLSS